jgi:hypothetical protein
MIRPSSGPRSPGSPWDAWVPLLAALSNAEVEAIYRSRLDAARSRFTEADVRFMTDMIHHHAQAIEISRLAPDRAAWGSVKTLAARIINAQQDEIATMQRWLADRNQPVPELHVSGDRIMVHAPAGRAGQVGQAGHAAHAGSRPRRHARHAHRRTGRTNSRPPRAAFDRPS